MVNLELKGGAAYPLLVGFDEEKDDGRVLAGHEALPCEYNRLSFRRALIAALFPGLFFAAATTLGIFLVLGFFPAVFGERIGEAIHPGYGLLARDLLLILSGLAGLSVAFLWVFIGIVNSGGGYRVRVTVDGIEIRRSLGSRYIPARSIRRLGSYWYTSYSARYKTTYYREKGIPTGWSRSVLSGLLVEDATGTEVIGGADGGELENAFRCLARILGVDYVAAARTNPETRSSHPLRYIRDRILSRRSDPSYIAPRPIEPSVPRPIMALWPGSKWLYYAEEIGRRGEKRRVRYLDGTEIDLDPEMIHDRGEAKGEFQCRWESDGRYYPCTVIEVGKKRARVLFKDGTESEVTLERLRATA